MRAELLRLGVLSPHEIESLLARLARETGQAFTSKACAAVRDLCVHRLAWVAVFRPEVPGPRFMPAGSTLPAGAWRRQGWVARREGAARGTPRAGSRTWLLRADGTPGTPWGRPASVRAILVTGAGGTFVDPLGPSTTGALTGAGGSDEGKDKDEAKAGKKKKNKA